MKLPFAANVSREMTGIFLAAVALGLVFNHSSPLGVSFSGTGALMPAAIPSSVRLNSPSMTESDPALHNETILAVMVASGPEDAALSAHKLPASLSWAEVKPSLVKGEIVLLDGREAAAYEAGHIPGAISLPLQNLAARMGSFAAQYPKNKSLVIYCASIRCPIAQAEAKVLAEQYGYLDVREMPGGFAEWRVAEPAATLATGANP